MPLYIKFRLGAVLALRLLGKKKTIASAETSKMIYFVHYLQTSQKSLQGIHCAFARF